MLEVCHGAYMNNKITYFQVLVPGVLYTLSVEWKFDLQFEFVAHSAAQSVSVWVLVLVGACSE